MRFTHPLSHNLFDGFFLQCGDVVGMGKNIFEKKGRPFSAVMMPWN